MESSDRLIVKNAAMLYLRMFVNMALGFYTSRIVLQALGVDDYGIFNLVGGIIVLMNMLTSSFAAGTSRFITYALGEDDMERVRQTYSTAMRLHMQLALLFVAVAETAGLWFVNTQLNIAPGRMEAANWVFQASVVVTATGITQVPYSALLTSHERFNVFAGMEISFSFLKLGIAFAIMLIGSGRLTAYSCLYAAVSVGMMMAYRHYCRRHFSSCMERRPVCKAMRRDMLGFSGWNMLYNTSGTVSTQGRSVLLNWFFGTALNAASGVALQVHSAVYAFISNITAAFQPQLTKSVARNEAARMNDLINTGGVFSALCILMISIPAMVKMPYIMSLWLVQVPEGAAVICIFLLLGNCFRCYTPLTMYAIYAANRIKVPDIILSAMHLSMPAVLYAVLRATHSYTWAFAFTLVEAIVPPAVFMVYLRHICPAFAIRRFVWRTIAPTMGAGCLGGAACISLATVLPDSIPSLLALMLASAVTIGLPSYFLVLTPRQRLQARSLIGRLLHRQ